MRVVASERVDASSGQNLSLLWQRRWFIVAVVLGATIFSGVLLSLVTPVYTAEALVALNTRPGQIVQTGLSTPPSPPTAATVQTEMDILRSRELAAQVVDELGLREDPEFNVSLREQGWLSRQGERVGVWILGAWESAAAQLGFQWGTPAEPGARGDRELGRTIERVMDRLDVGTDAESLVIRVKFAAESPRKAANVANAFADIYVRNQIRNKFEEVERATGWIVQQIAALRGELAEDADTLAAFREKNQLAPNNDPSLLAAQELVALTAQISMVEKERVDAESALAETRRLLARGAGGAMDLIGTSPVLQVLRAKEADVRAQIADLSTRYKEAHPRLAALREQLTALQAEMDAEVAQGVQALTARVAQARSREQALRARMREVTQAASATNRTFTEVRLRERDIEAKNALLSSFLARYNEIANRMEIEKPDARIASLAVPPVEPSHPKPLLFLGIAFTGSLGLGMSLVLLLERFRAGFLNTRQVKEELGLPTVGIVPVMRGLPRQGGLADHVLQKPRSVYSEAIRSAQLSVLNAAVQSGSRRILVTSSVPGEGKTAFAISLARSLANNGYRTLLVDFDFRRPSVARRLGLPPEPGLADFLRQEAPIEDVIRVDEATGLNVAPAGARANQDPLRLLNSHLMSSSLNAFMEGYEVVIVDSPPTMVASDSALLARGCDAALYVVEWDKTPRHAVLAGVEYLQSMGGKVAGVILSKVNFNKQKQHTDYVDFCFRYEDYYTK